MHEALLCDFIPHPIPLFAVKTRIHVFKYRSLMQLRHTLCCNIHFMMSDQRAALAIPIRVCLLENGGCWSWECRTWR
jgi:hypothetical protein